MFGAFVAAAFVLAVTPGPGILYIVTRTLSQGRKAGLASVAGVALGNLGNAVFASLGLAAVLAASELAFGIVKFTGAAYLMVLGLQALRNRPANSPSGQTTIASVTDTSRQTVRDGFFVALLNPKTALFFAALVPQFMDGSAAPFGQTLTLSLSFVAIAMVTDTACVLLAAKVAPALNSNAVDALPNALPNALQNAPPNARHWQIFSGCTYLALGIWAALAKWPIR